MKGLSPSAQALMFIYITIEVKLCQSCSSHLACSEASFVVTC